MTHEKLDALLVFGTIAVAYLCGVVMGYLSAWSGKGKSHVGRQNDT